MLFVEEWGEKDEKRRKKKIVCSTIVPPAVLALHTWAELETAVKLLLCVAMCDLGLWSRH